MIDPGDKGGTAIWMDSDTGRKVEFWAPTGRSNGETVDVWLMQLHFCFVLRLPYRILIMVIEIMSTVLSVTGVVIWLKKGRGRTGKVRRAG